MNTDQTVHTPVSNYFLPPILIHPPSLYTPPFLPECSSECFPFFTIHLFFCSIWVPLIGGGSGFPVLHTTLKNRLSEHFIFFQLSQLEQTAKKIMFTCTLQRTTPKFMLKRCFILRGD